MTAEELALMDDYLDGTLPDVLRSNYFKEVSPNSLIQQPIDPAGSDSLDTGEEDSLRLPSAPSHR